MSAPRRDPFDKQIQNRNYLSDVGFKFSLAKAPKVDFFSNTATLPGLTLGVVNQPSYLKELPLPGDRLVYDDLELTFIVDEELENWMAIHNWMRGLGFPNSIGDFISEVTNDDGLVERERQYSDGTLIVLNNQFIPTNIPTSAPTNIPMLKSFSLPPSPLSEVPCTSSQGGQRCNL